MPWRALEVTNPQPLFEAAGSGLTYLHRFLNNQPRLEASAQVALSRTVRVVFSTVRTGLLDEHKDAARSDHCPHPSAVSSVACPSVEIGRKKPDGMFAHPDRPFCSCLRGSSLKQIRVRQQYRPMMRLPFWEYSREECPLGGTRILRPPLSALLRIWPRFSKQLPHGGCGQLSALSGEKTESAVCTLVELRVSRTKSTLFVGPANDWLRELAASLVQELTVVPSDSVGRLVFDRRIAGGGPAGCSCLAD